MLINQKVGTNANSARSTCKNNRYECGIKVWYTGCMNLCRHCKQKEGDFVDCTTIRFLKKKKEWITRKYFTCRECNTERARKYRETVTGLERVKSAVYRSILKYPQKQKAREILNESIRVGKLVRGLCEICGDLNVHGHHDDYSRPLEVRWLCTVHHSQAHHEVV